MQHSTPQPDALLLTPEEAARRLSIARSSLYELVLTGDLASIKIGRSRRILVDGLTDYIERKRREQDKDAGALEKEKPR